MGNTPVQQSEYRVGTRSASNHGVSTSGQALSEVCALFWEVNRDTTQVSSLWRRGRRTQVILPAKDSRT